MLHLNELDAPTRALARFVAMTAFADLPEEIVEQTKKLTLDLLGVALLASLDDASRTLSEVASGMGEGESTVLGSGRRAPAQVATMLNAAAAHQIGLADAVSRAEVHCSTAVVPAALAVGEREGSSGEKFLRAVALGGEVLIRFGHAFDPFSFDERRPLGWFKPVLLSPIGAATAAVLLLSPDSDVLHHAWGLASNMCPTATFASFREGRSGRGALMGVGCANGVLAADIAKGGFTGLENIEDGWMRFVEDAPKIERLDARLGEHYELGRVLYKFAATIGPLLAPIEAVCALLERERFAPEDVAAVEVQCYRNTMRYYRLSLPDGPEAARSDLRFAVATAIVSRSRTALLSDAFTAGAVQDARRRELATKVRATLNASYDALYPHSAAKALVRIRLRDGTVLESEVDRDGLARSYRPTRAQVEDKFRATAGAVLDRKVADAVIGAVWELERLADVRELTELLRGE